MRWFLTGDTHFFHANIIKYCDRPFASVDKMNSILVENWNRVVRPSDSVIHCGDFAFARQSKQVTDLIKSLHGKIHLIIGNHDRGAVTTADGFASISMLRRFTINHIEIVACHYAMRVWDKSHYGVYHCYGHSHGTLTDDPVMRSGDVGVDANNFSPVQLDEFVARMDKKSFVPMTTRTLL